MITTTKFWLWLGMIVFIMPIEAVAEKQQSLAFYTWAENLAPIISKNDQSGEFTGIVVDIFDSISGEESVHVDYEVHNRIRGEKLLYSGVFQATILSPQWVAEPAKLLFSDPIYQHVEHLYATAPIANQPIVQLIKNRTICTRRGYRYPTLDNLFEEKYAKRVDSHSEEAMLRMLLLKRCDFVLSNEFVAQWLIDKFEWQNAIYKSPLAVDRVGFKLAFHPDQFLFVAKLNEHISHLKQTGQLAHIIEFHRNVAVQQIYFQK